MTGPLRAGVLGATGSWHTRGLLAALDRRGVDALAIPATRLQSEIVPAAAPSGATTATAAGAGTPGAAAAAAADGAGALLGPGGAALHELDLLFVRGLPRGSLEQVIFRVDTLHVLADQHGVRVVNPPRAIERTVDKSWCSALLAAAGVPTPPTAVCERFEDALSAFARLGGDVVVKPLFGAMGSGIVRVDDADVAHRVFRALELERAVYYLQRTVDGPGRRDLRVLVVAGEVVAAMERVTDSWRANVARGAQPRAVALSEREREPALAAAAAVGADVAGVDLLVSADGDVVVPEVNGIPGWQALQSVCDRDLTAHVVDAVLP